MFTYIRGSCEGGKWGESMGKSRGGLGSGIVRIIVKGVLRGDPDSLRGIARKKGKTDKACMAWSCVEWWWVGGLLTILKVEMEVCGSYWL